MLFNAVAGIPAGKMAATSFLIIQFDTVSKSFPIVDVLPAKEIKPLFTTLNAVVFDPSMIKLFNLFSWAPLTNKTTGPLAELRRLKFLKVVLVLKSGIPVILILSDPFKRINPAPTEPVMVRVTANALESGLIVILKLPIPHPPVPI